jgi:hypothetical protein
MNFLHPFYLSVTGPSQSGKSYWVLKLLDHVDTLVNPHPEFIFYFYNNYMPDFGRFKGINFQKGLPDNFEFLKEIKGRKLVILDDFMGNKQAEKALEDLSVRGVHHQDTSVIQ